MIRTRFIIYFIIIILKFVLKFKYNLIVVSCDMKKRFQDLKQQTMNMR